MDEQEALMASNDLLFSCFRHRSKIEHVDWKTASENDSSYLVEPFSRMMNEFFCEIVQHYKDIEGNYPFSDLKIDAFPEMPKAKTSKDFWNEISDEQYPSNLTNISMFKHLNVDASITYSDDQGTRNYLFGINVKEPNFSLVLNPEDKFKSLKGLLRDTMRYMISQGDTSHFISDGRKTLYIELPVGSGTWKSSDNEEVMLIDAPLRYMIFDNTAERKDAGLSFQTMVAIKVLDKLRIMSGDGLRGIIDNQYEHPYQPLGRVQEADGYFEFAKALVKEGFKSLAPPKAELEISGINGNFVSTSTRDIFKNQREYKCEEVGDLFPVDLLLEPKEFCVLEEHTNTTSTKFLLPIAKSSDCSTVTNRSVPECSQKAFFKLFDLYWLRYLHMISLGPRPDPLVDALKQSDLGVVYLLEDYDEEDFKDVESSVKSTFIRELIALKRIESWNRDHPSEQINSPKLLEHGWAIVNYPNHRTYGGPFLAFENLKFIQRNRIEGISRREDSFKQQQELLLKAGIDHHDIKEGNLCFDDDDNCYIVDYGLSTVDGEEICKKYKLHDLSAPE